MVKYSASRWDFDEIHLLLSFRTSKLFTANADCRAKIKDTADTSSLHCASCDHALGIVDTASEGWKLYKWSLSIVKEDQTKEWFPVPKWISTQLLGAVDSSGVRRFVVEPSARTDNKTGGLLVCP